MTASYITTTLPYVNGDPHIGFGLEIVAADVMARAHALLGDKVIFNTGTDEHGQKIADKAAELGLQPQAYVDEQAQKFRNLQTQLHLAHFDKTDEENYQNIEFKFIRTTNDYHKLAAQELWQRVAANGYIEKRPYQAKYCVGCELEKTDSELVDGRCPLHPDKDIQLIDEENYFFRFSDFQNQLLSLYESNPNFIKPASKMKELQAFVARGLQDFSISRLKSKMSWGVPVPGDDDHVMYVWFDALTNYISTLGWPNNVDEYELFWPGVQLAGKDNLRQQGAMWQAMLLAAGLPTSKQVYINGFINVAGQKMSKSLGNVISPADLIERYGVEATRFLLMNLGTFGEDIDVTWERLDQDYGSLLVNGLGNLTSRVAALFGTEAIAEAFSVINMAENWQSLARGEISAGMQNINQLVTQLDGALSAHKPWTMTAEERASWWKAGFDAEFGGLWFSLRPLLPLSYRQLLEWVARGEGRLPGLFPRLSTP